MNNCDQFNPDNVFKRFKVVEFPTSFIGLATSQDLNIQVDLEKSAYLKTMCQGRLMLFEEAREISAAHRAFHITKVDEKSIKITFKPLNECIARIKQRQNNYDNRFVFDLRLLQVNGRRCCSNEFHSEIGRYYVSGGYEACVITHYPNIVDFGEVDLNIKVTSYIRIRNNSNITMKLSLARAAGVDASPRKFTVSPSSSVRVAVSIKPSCLKIKSELNFKVRNPHDKYDEPIFEDPNDKNDNYLTYSIEIKANIIYKPLKKTVVVDSLHKLFNQNPHFTFINEELTEHRKRKTEALKMLKMLKYSKSLKVPKKDKTINGKAICCNDIIIPRTKSSDFCKQIPARVSGPEVLGIVIIPFFIDFGRIGLHTFGEKDVVIINETRYMVSVRLLDDEYVRYSNNKLKNMTIKLKGFSKTSVSIKCLGFVEGNYSGHFEYAIDNKYYRLHPYSLQVGTPTLMISENVFKFGMVTNESFVTSVPIRICNNFNVPIDYEWSEILTDLPFEVIPTSGSIPKHSTRICDIIYIYKSLKLKNYEMELHSKSTNTKVIPIELNVITRKLSIKFLQPYINFKDIPLNIEMKERVKLENSSKEIAGFHIVEPLIPGIKIEPMSGIIRPKMILVFEVTVKISCILDFSFDINVRINNKENITLVVSGNVVEPKVVIHPKNIYMARVPCGMISYVPISIQNTSLLKALIEILDTGDENIFQVYTGSEKQRIFSFVLEGGESKVVFVKVYDIYRREYEMYLPFKINGLLGPPDQNSWTTEMQHYTGPYEQLYENNFKVKVKSVNKDISYCRIAGVITVAWIEFSTDKFEIEYEPNGLNCLKFTMTNVSKYYLHVTIMISKLAPNFSLQVETVDSRSIASESHIKFELDRSCGAKFYLKFHPKGHGRFVAVPVLYLDKNLTLPYYNLTFVGNRQTPRMKPSTNRIIFPPCYIGIPMSRMISIRMEAAATLESFNCSSKEEPKLIAKFINCEVFHVGKETYSIVSIKISVCSHHNYARTMTLSFNHEEGSGCEVEVTFSYTYCPLTLHTNSIVSLEENPYPFYPLSSQTELYEYLENCVSFLEKWLFQQGFRRDLFPVIPDTFHAISNTISTGNIGTKSKGINVTFLNFFRRIAGPLMKHIHKISLHGVHESFKMVKEIHDTYRQLISLLRSRGSNLWVLQAKFLLSYNQFVVYNENVAPKGNADIMLIQSLLADPDLFNRLSKQSWLDFILQSYKVFVVDSCFFECVCVSLQSRDVIKVMVEWYNEQIALANKKLHGNKPAKIIKNLTTDLSDGQAIISTFLNHCPYLENHFSTFCDIDEGSFETVVVNNACLIVEALNLLKINFPLTCKDFIKPLFLQMLFLSIHLNITLPMLVPKTVIEFNPVILKSSTRLVGISPASQETLTFNYVILNNDKNAFLVDKYPLNENNGKKIYLSVKYIANFLEKDTAILLVHGYNKTRIFDTYVVFILVGHVGVLQPLKKCRVSGPLYRPNKVDILVSSPFPTTAVYHVHVTDIEPSLPVHFNICDKPKFYVKRLNLIEKEVMLTGVPKDMNVQDIQEHKVYFQMICLNTQIGNSWIWFRSEVGVFFIRVTTQPRWDLATETLQTKVESWPMDPCNCGELCECYRTTVVMIPHRNELMLKSLRYAILEHASGTMMEIYDELIGSSTGKVILSMLLLEGGTNINEIQHILCNTSAYRITSRNLVPRLERAVLAHHTDAMLALPVTIPPNDKAEKYTIMFTSECGLDIRIYRIIFVGDGSQ